MTDSGPPQEERRSSPKKRREDTSSPQQSRTEQMSQADLDSARQSANADSSSSSDSRRDESADVSQTQSQMAPVSGTQPSLRAGEALNASQTLAQTLLTGTRIGASVDLQDFMLGEFRLLRRLGSGGMAQVYLAEQTSLKRNVAIKIMRPDFSSDSTYQKRFEHEARAAAGLNHPNIVQVFAVGDQDGLRYIAQEYVHGLNLRQYLQKKKPPTSHAAMHLMKQVCSALNAAHQAGIVHRDIKPENIMVTRKMVAKVTDFGLAQLTLGGERVNLTQMGQTMGTPLYMSPEQVNAADVDHRSDLYSLGVSFYHLITGQPPFRANTAVALAYKHLHEDPESLAAIRPDLPPSFIRLIERLMAKKPEDRFPDAKSVLTELKRIEKSDEKGGEWNVAAASEQTDVRSPFHVPKSRLKALGFACLFVFLMAAGRGREARRINPLDDTEPRTSVNIEATASEQIAVATRLANGPSNPETVEEAWRAVIENFPDSKKEVMRARRELGVLQTLQHRFDEALENFDELARQNDNQLKADGLAGQAALLSFTDHFAESHALMTIELRGFEKSISPQMRPLIAHAVERNSRHSGSRNEQLESLFRTEEPDRP